MGAEAPAQEEHAEKDDDDEAAGFDFGYQRGWQRHACSILEPIHKE